MSTRTATPLLAPGVLYTARDRLVCADCAGNTALYTGRTSEGHPVRRWSEEDSAVWEEHGLGPYAWCDCHGVRVVTTPGTVTQSVTADLSTLRPGDRIIAAAGRTLRTPWVVAAALAPVVPGGPEGVRCEPTPAEAASGFERVLYPATFRGFCLTYQRTH